MTRWLKNPKQRRIVTYALLGLIVVALLWPLAVSRDGRHLSAYRAGEEDVSRFRSEIVALGLRTEAYAATPYPLRDVEEPSQTLLVVVGAERRYDPSEARAVIEFVRAGGTLLLADESGFGSDVAREAGFAFSAQRVLDTRNYRGDPQLVVANAQVGEQAYRVVFNSPAKLVALSGHGPYDKLAETSPSKYPDGSYLDANANGEIDISDEPGPFPLIVRTTLGEGRLVLVSDSGVFMNAQLGLADYDNARFLSALVRSLASNEGVVILDESRHAPPALVAPWANGVRGLGRLAGGDVSPFVIVAVVALATLVAWYATRPTEDWTHHAFDVSHVQPLPGTIAPDASRIQRMARAHISEKFNKALEEVSAMTAEELLALTRDRILADAASGTYRADLAPFFQTVFPAASPKPQESPP